MLKAAALIAHLLLHCSFQPKQKAGLLIYGTDARASFGFPVKESPSAFRHSSGNKPIPELGSGTKGNHMLHILSIARAIP